LPLCFFWPPRPPHSGGHQTPPLKMRTAALWRPSRSRGLAKFVLFIYFAYISIDDLWIPPPRSIAGGCIHMVLKIFAISPAEASGFAPAAARCILRGPDFSGPGPLYITVSPYLAARARFLPSSARGIPPEKPLDPAENTRVYVNYGNCRNVGKAAKKPRGRGG